MPFPQPPQKKPMPPRGGVSSSAPPPFRAKKLPADNPNRNPVPQNAGRLTGPPMQMGAGKGSMFADGGFGSPAPIGGGDPGPDPGAPPPPAPSPAGAPGGMDPDHDGDMDSPVIKPEAVNYHDDPHSCQLCMYFGQDGQCAVLKMQVSPEGGCTAFEGGGGATPDDGSGGAPLQDDTSDMDMTGGPQG